ncbi:MAG: DoxX family protein, partial [Flavobacteriaceae bacterium]|nr:DoxX family protein [Flavobacteriaceae bacterium]
LNFEFYLCDEKALKTVVRANPGVLQLNEGTVEQKVHWNDIEDLAL